MKALGLNPGEQEVVDMTNEVKRRRSRSRGRRRSRSRSRRNNRSRSRM